ncbi:Ig-like domain-containing protein [Neobacillus cucumis]|uniref:Ig-like domain-containing protein n=1 Tax=Neobacillus cucumis TaxID=1740721 RepID=UPI00203FCB00|nr:Ig-like domain-containing protein [Neobacillus cucumis]MCM3729661.1 Ig-like domain-containing protein [Neobacillus cucumis]
MRSILLKVFLLTCFILPVWTHENASAEMTWPAKCASFGALMPNQNPSFQYINCLLTNAALAANIPPEVVKAVAVQESGLRQFDSGKPLITPDSGIGIMQITNQSSYDQQRLKDDIIYNIQAGVDILSSMYQRKDLPKIKEAGPEVIENWYFPVMAYNGTKPINSPFVQKDGSRNADAYQEEVFTKIEQNSFLDNTKLGQYPFSTADFVYKSGSAENILFNKLQYTLTDQMHASMSLFQTGNKVVTIGEVNLRSKPTTQNSPILKLLAKNTTLIINGDFKYDQNISSLNQFVWYPVKTEDQKLVGYIPSAYIIKKLESPVISPVDDNDAAVSGTAPANALVQIMNGNKLIGSAMANANKSFKASIPVQKAGTKLTILYKDQLNALSPSVTIVVADKTAPVAPTVNSVTNKSSELSGKTEANATVTVTIAGKAYSKKVDGTGNFKVVIPVQNAATKISVSAKDSAGNIGAARTLTVVKAAPNIPSVNTVNNKAVTVTGKTEANVTVAVVIAGKSYTAKADKYGNYKVAIPVQNTGMSLSVTAKDSAGRISAPRSTAVIRVAPNMPTVNTVRYYSTAVTGKTEKNVTVVIKIGTKTYTTKANAYGDYKLNISKQRAGTKLYVYAKDAYGKVSATRTVTVY